MAFYKNFEGTGIAQFDFDPGDQWVEITEDEYNVFNAGFYKDQGLFNIKATRSTVRNYPQTLQDNTLDDGRGYAVFVDEFIPLGITQVRFDLDGVVHNTEFSAPWDFNGTDVGGEAIKYVFAPGVHEIDAHITYGGGSVITLTATFEVD